MSEIYEFTLKQEVLMEKGADVQGEVFHFQRQAPSASLGKAVGILYELVGVAKHDILTAQSENELNCIESKFDLAREYINELKEYCMNPAYEMTLRKEVLLEKGAAVLADLFQYKQNNSIKDDLHPVSIMFTLVYNAKEDIVGAKTDADLDHIDGKFEMAKEFLRETTASSGM